MKNVPGAPRPLRQAVQRLRNRLRPDAMLKRVRWYGTDSSQDGARALALRALELAGGGDIVSLGDGGTLHAMVDAEIRRRGGSVKAMSLNALISAEGADEIAAIACAFPDARRTAQAERALRQHPRLSTVPFEYVVGLEPERALFGQRDEYHDARFVGPELIDEIPVHDIYEASLQRFEQKCGLRDYLDLFQCLRNVVERQVPGDIAEFGSYKGHSGYLIARLLQYLDGQRRLFMFDTFDAFPEESLGVDRFWSGTHAVSFEQVRQQFAEFPKVSLVRGDFGSTLPDSGLETLALAYVDCDSYRGVRYVADTLWETHIAPGGCMVFEDYGHPALLGARSAVHEFFDGRRDAIRWYSHFSGLYIVFKT